jgi:hypothetical protein
VVFGECCRDERIIISFHQVINILHCFSKDYVFWSWTKSLFNEILTYEEESFKKLHFVLICSWVT